MGFEYLTQDQLDQLYLDGYLRIPGFLSPDETDVLLKRAHQLLGDFKVEDHPLTKFTTSDENHVGDDYFLTSGDKIRYFLEEDAVGADGKLNREKDKAVNKIGHALHELDPAFRAVTLENDNIRSIVRDVKFHHDPVVPPHNDSTFLYTNPPSALGFWFALEKCTAENGALSFLPGSHYLAPITKRFVRLPQGGTGFEDLIPPEKVPPAPEGEYVLVTCEPGDLVIIHGSVLHKSERNTSSKTRFAYTFHMIESPPYAEYDQKNWLQPTPEMPFSKILDTPNPVVEMDI
ncbi:hypothetical protein NLI96_g3524 [Meripilus lineatus]|uniref:Phytanoyl-CoA dioxygenase n=1 Tax=Meripilus lineatus TaxID=2056292 RepID=A0AAD5YFK7_9APHY|nr:hypothetical protein NLI96_g3524 [Physisporinus lineatus]